MKSLLNNIKVTAMVLSLLLASQSSADPVLNNQSEAAAAGALELPNVAPKQAAGHILLVKDENGKWTLFNGSELFFPENETDGFKIIKLPGHKADGLEELSLVNGNPGRPGDIINGANNGFFGAPGSGANAVAQMLGKAAPYLTTIARVAAGAGLIALGVKFGGLALSAGMIAGLSVLGMPVGTAVAVAGLITMSTGAQSSMLGGLAQSIVSKIPFLGSWFGSSSSQLLDKLDALKVPTHLPSTVLGGAAKCAVALTC